MCFLLIQHIKIKICYFHLCNYQNLWIAVLILKDFSKPITLSKLISKMHNGHKSFESRKLR